MSGYRRSLVAALLAAAFCGGVAAGQTERLELLGNLKFFGTGNGIIFPDGTKQTSAGVGSSTDLVCTTCVGSGEIAAGAVGSAEIANGAIRLSNMNLIVLLDREFNYPGFVGSGQCSPYLAIAVPGAPANAFAMVYGVRGLGGVAGWLIEGERTPASIEGHINIRSCNGTTTGSEAPNVKFDAWVITP